MTLFDFIWLTGSSAAFMLTLAYSLNHNIKTDVRGGEIIGSLILGLVFSWALVVVHLSMFYKGNWRDD